MEICIFANTNVGRETKRSDVKGQPGIKAVSMAPDCKRPLMMADPPVNDISASNRIHGHKPSGIETNILDKVCFSVGFFEF